MNRWALYGVANLVFSLIVLGGHGLAEPADPIHPAYLMLLFAQCSAPLLFIRVLNDRYALLGLFALIYFVLFGLLDLVILLFSSGTALPAPEGVISAAEAVILVGGFVTQLGYHLTCGAVHANRPADESARDWSQAGLVLGGAVLWSASTWVTWKLKVELLVDSSIDTASRAFGAMSALQLDAILIANYMQPLGVIILAYAYSVHRKPYILVGLLGAILVEMVLGLVSDSKGQVLIGIILATFTRALVYGRLSKTWLAVAAAVIVVAFPILQANRISMQMRGTGHSEAAEDIGTTLSRALETSKSVSTGHYRAESFIERSSLKNSLTMIVEKTGDSVEFQHGHTLSTLLYAFIPRAVWPDKPDVATGRLVNSEFHVSDQPDTNVSPSHLGELYWNFGWPGVIFGMALIGALLGAIGARFDLTRAVTLTRILVLIATLKLLILGSEGVINVGYAVWIRTVVAIGLLHLIFARVRVTGISSADRSSATPQTPNTTGARYPNLMA